MEQELQVRSMKVYNVQYTISLALGMQPWPTTFSCYDMAWTLCPFVLFNHAKNLLLFCIWVRKAQYSKSNSC
jgi:hypothetical protein